MDGDNLVRWQAAELSDQSRQAFYDAALARQESAEKDAAAVRRLGLLFGAAGLAIGALGVVAATVVLTRAPVPEPPGYIFVDKQAGTVSQPVAAVDAPASYPDSVRQRAVWSFLTACESYVPQTWNKLDYHACMLQAAPDEQKRRAADIAPGGPHYPPPLFPAGWAMPTGVPTFVLLGSTGNPPNITYSYEVRYERTEVMNGRESRPHYTARLAVQFHPELKMSNADRLLNPMGTQVVSFSTVRD